MVSALSSSMPNVLGCPAEESSGPDGLPARITWFGCTGDWAAAFSRVWSSVITSAWLAQWIRGT